MAIAGRPAHDSAYVLGAGVLLGALATILAALGFEHLGGYLPCELCLQERYAYYASIPLMFVALSLLVAGWKRAAALLTFLVALAFLANAALGTYHAGFEWGFWPGPTTCSGALQPLGPLEPGKGDLLEQLKNIRIVRCDTPSWRLFGISFAGYNALISLVLFTGALKAAFAAASRRDG